jgi:hypothetical protein
MPRNSGVEAVMSLPLRVRMRRTSVDVNHASPAVELRLNRDPFGPPLWTGHASNQGEGIRLVDKVARQIRSGSAPWSTTYASLTINL